MTSLLPLREALREGKNLEELRELPIVRERLSAIPATATITPEEIIKGMVLEMLDRHPMPILELRIMKTKILWPQQITEFEEKIKGTAEKLYQVVAGTIPLSNSDELLQFCKKGWGFVGRTYVRWEQMLKVWNGAIPFSLDSVEPCADLERLVPPGDRDLNFRRFSVRLSVLALQQREQVVLTDLFSQSLEEALHTHELLRQESFLFSKNQHSIRYPSENIRQLFVSIADFSTIKRSLQHVDPLLHQWFTDSSPAIQNRALQRISSQRFSEESFQRAFDLTKGLPLSRPNKLEALLLFYDFPQAASIIGFPHLLEEGLFLYLLTQKIDPGYYTFYEKSCAYLSKTAADFGVSEPPPATLVVLLNSQPMLEKVAEFVRLFRSSRPTGENFYKALTRFCKDEYSVTEVRFLIGKKLSLEECIDIFAHTVTKIPERLDNIREGLAKSKVRELQALHGWNGIQATRLFLRYCSLLQSPDKKNLEDLEFFLRAPLHKDLVFDLFYFLPQHAWSILNERRQVCSDKLRILLGINKPMFHPSEILPLIRENQLLVAGFEKEDEFRTFKRIIELLNQALLPSSQTVLQFLNVQKVEAGIFPLTPPGDALHNTLFPIHDDLPLAPLVLCRWIMPSLNVDVPEFEFFMISPSNHNSRSFRVKLTGITLEALEQDFTLLPMFTKLCHFAKYDGIFSCIESQKTKLEFLETESELREEWRQFTPAFSKVAFAQSVFDFIDKVMNSFRLIHYSLLGQNTPLFAKKRYEFASEGFTLPGIQSPNPTIIQDEEKGSLGYVLPQNVVDQLPSVVAIIRQNQLTTMQSLPSLTTLSSNNLLLHWSYDPHKSHEITFTLSNVEMRWQYSSQIQHPHLENLLHVQLLQLLSAYHRKLSSHH